MHAMANTPAWGEDENKNRIERIKLWVFLAINDTALVFWSLHHYCVDWTGSATAVERRD